MGELTVTDLPQRIADRFVASDDHWVWTGWVNDDGYGYVRWEGRDQPVHRVVYTLLVGPIPADYDLDHACRLRPCCRPHPDHLEPVTHAENMRRTRPTKCRRAGHDWSDPRNVRTRRDGRRLCAECERQDMRARYAARRRAA